jgi:hypothetical protein
MPKGVYDHQAALHTFPENYIQECFYKWYAAGCPKQIAKIIEIVPADVDGIKPNANQIRSWLANDWVPHAEALNAESEKDIEIKLIDQRKEILSRQAEEGKLLQEKGMEFLKEGKFKNAGEAIRAVIMGAALESKASGIDLFMDIMGKSNKELLQFIKEQQTKSKGDNMDGLDAEFEEELDAPSTDEGND